MQKPDTKRTRLLLVRHGQTRANQEHLLQGASDGPLTTEGEAQVEQLGLHLRRFPIEHVISSDLVRAYATAQAIAKHHNLTVETTALVQEWDCGVWDGRTAEEFLDMLAHSGKPVSAFSPQGGETLEHVRGRAEAFIETVLAQHSGKTVVLCSHGDFMRMLVGCLLGIGIDQANLFFFNNGSYSLFENEGTDWKVIAINRLPDPEWELF
jgi:broad specificity phosphatase PhoE